MNALKNNKGFAFPLILIVVFSVLCIITVLWQTGMYKAKIKTVEKALYQTALTAVTKNTEETYNDKREGFTGAYAQNADWVNTIETIDAKDQLIQILDLIETGSTLNKVDGNGDTLYSLSNVQLELKNTEPLNEETFIQANVVADLNFVVTYPLVGGKDISLTISTSAKNISKY